MKKIRLIELSKNDLKKINGGYVAAATCTCNCGDSDTSSSQMRSTNNGTTVSVLNPPQPE